VGSLAGLHVGHVVDEGGSQQAQGGGRDCQEQQEPHPIGREAGGVDGAEDAGTQTQKSLQNSCMPRGPSLSIIYAPPSIQKRPQRNSQRRGGGALLLNKF